MSAPRRLDSRAAGFEEALAALCAWDEGRQAGVESTVRGIVREVRERGDEALIEYTARFDHWIPETAGALEISRSRQRAAAERVPPPLRRALGEAADRIRSFHEHQLEPSWEIDNGDGTTLGQRIHALERAGLYVPGGKAAYPSSVLMNALPAKVAGVPEIIMVVPTPGGELNDAVLAAAVEGGVDRIFAVGGAQAVAALAYGTETVPAVDKIVGPGNAYVATAKRLVFGQVGIDMVAGPSEIVVVGDGTSRADWVAMDLFSQAEHDEDARAVLISPDEAFLEQVAEEMARLLPTMERRDIISRSLATHGALIAVRDLDEAADVVNRIAPEHLELCVADPDGLLPSIRHAGAIFLGNHASEALGDYCAGPNHVLPTGRTARFSSPLGVYDFQKRSSVIKISDRAARALAPVAETLARAEGLEAHGRSARLRAEADFDGT